ncbi:YtzI protein [Gottfriedia sp. NPDC057991]|uniref:YtzI protein n=1 Tax=Gottfriedia sp. NPDC057991 TaxID=3346298 RepID=UPI0036DA5207
MRLSVKNEVHVIPLIVVFGAFVVTVNKGYGVKHKVDEINIKNVYDDKNDK